MPCSHCKKPTIRAGRVRRVGKVRMWNYDDDKNESMFEQQTSLTQPTKTQATKKKKVAKPPLPPVALKTCTVKLDNVIVELVEGQPITGLTRQERNHLKFHKFIK